jgi:hypothetical protein
MFMVVMAALRRHGQLAGIGQIAQRLDAVAQPEDIIVDR